MLKSSICAAVAEITNGNLKNQMEALKQGLIPPICELFKSRNITVQLKVSMAIDSLATNNQSIQDAILELDAASYLIRLLEVRILVKKK
jgi:hypothetical protein